MTVYLSNRLEHLAKDLKENLFASSSFFSKRIVIFPNTTIKEYIFQYLSDETKGKVAFGLLPFYLEEGIAFLADKFFTSELQKKTLNPLQLVLQIDEHLNTSIKEAESLAILFEKYGKYGIPKHDEMQKKVWEKVYEHHTFPLEFLSQLNEKEAIDANYSVHIFGFNELPPIYVSFFHRLANRIPLNIYHLSPCQEFWSDFRSDKEAKRVKANDTLQATLEEFLEDQHPLLANLGVVGREFAKMVEESEFLTKECYDEACGDSELSLLQQEILTLTKNGSKTFDDDSLQIHIHTTRHREIENLYNILCHLIAEKGIKPHEIMVLAPHIGEYAPYIPACFKQIPFRICDMPSETTDIEVLGLLQLIELEETRWGASMVMALFSHPLFCKKHHLNDEDLSRIQHWIDKGAVKWGVNREHVNALLKKDHCKSEFNDDNVTWESSLKRLYNYFALYEEAGSMNIIESESLGKLSFLIETLYTGTRIFFDECEKTLGEWIDCLQAIFLEHFSEADTGSLLSKLGMIKRSGFNKKYPFLKIFPLIKTFLTKERVTIHGGQLQSVKFASLKPMHGLPARVVFLLGMQHDAFPKKDRLVSFDELRKEKKYASNILENDKYLFLEWLLLAKDYFFISYLGKSRQDQTTIPESSVVNELKRVTPCKNVVVHPDLSFDPLYFQNKNTLLKNSSQKDYEVALALFAPKTSLKPFFAKKEAFDPIPEGDHVIDVQELKKACRYPVGLFLEKTLNISFFEKTEQKDEETFLLTPLDLGSLRKKALQTSPEDVFKILENKGNSPLAAFKQLAKHRLEIPKIKTTTIEFSLFDKKPPLIFPYDEKRKIIFVGKIDNVTENGLFTFDKCSFASVIKHWSDFLLLNWGYNGAKTLFFGKDKKEKTPFFEESAPFLKNLITYYFHVRTNPLFLLPEWADAILERDHEKLEMLMEEQKTYDKGAVFALRCLSAQEVIETCAEMCDSLYKDMKDAWF